MGFFVVLILFFKYFSEDLLKIKGLYAIFTLENIGMITLFNNKLILNGHKIFNLNQFFEYFSKKFKSTINSKSDVEILLKYYKNLNIFIRHSDTFLKDETEAIRKEIISLLEKHGTVKLTGKSNIKNNYIKIGVGIMIKSGNKVLLGHRCKDKEDTGGIHEPDTRSFPGGKQEYNETVIHAAIREVKEETNLDISNPKVIAALDDIAPDRHFVTIGLICDEFSGELKCMEPSKEDEWKRFDLNNLPKNLYSPTKHLIDYYIHEYN